ncbi:MAG: hypothetical protein R3E79_43200 [Caldilineaceae bacterium]
MTIRYFSLMRMAMISLFMVLSLVLGACDMDGGEIGEDDGISIDEGIGEEGELGTDELDDD